MTKRPTKIKNKQTERRKENNSLIQEDDIIGKCYFLARIKEVTAKTYCILDKKKVPVTLSSRDVEQ